jgi:hypothetical protein
MEKCFFNSCPLNDKSYLYKFRSEYNFSNIVDKNLGNYVKNK